MRDFMAMRQAEKMSQRHLWLGWGLFLVMAWFVSVAAESPRKPNIIFVLADDMGYRDLSAFGQQARQTPHLDRLAHNGMIFNHAYAGAAMCAASRAVLMTLIAKDLGKYKDAPWDIKHKEWAAMIDHLDRHVGELVALLTELKLLDNTIIFFASDNGYEPSYWNPQMRN
jgi:arylsulfatase A-like enzyme